MKTPAGSGVMAPARWILPAIGLTALALAASTYGIDRPLYFGVLHILMLQPYPTPFIDAQQVPAVIDCWRHGINVYVTAPCDPLGRVWAYSPLWFWAIFIPAWRNWMGLALDAGFFLSLALLPFPRERNGMTVMLTGMFSGMTVFGLERGNMDVLMFILLAAGGWFWVRRSPARLAAYGFFAVAGFLKFYPLVLFSLCIRERLGVFITLAVLGAALILLFAGAYHGLLWQAVGNLRRYSYFTESFGARQLPGGLAAGLCSVLRHATSRAALCTPAGRTGFFRAVWTVLTVCGIGHGLLLARRAAFAAALMQLTRAEFGFLVIGAAVLCGCFFAGMSDDYRGIHFLFVLPGMMALATASGGLFAVTAGSILFLMWGPTIQLLVAACSGASPFPMHGSLAIYAYWLIRELAWWWVVSVLLGVLLRFIAQSPPWAALTAPGRRWRTAGN